MTSEELTEDTMLDLISYQYDELERAQKKLTELEATQTRLDELTAANRNLIQDNQVLRQNIHRVSNQMIQQLTVLQKLLESIHKTLDAPFTDRKDMVRALLARRKECPIHSKDLQE